MKKIKAIVAVSMACLVMFGMLMAVSAPDRVMATQTDPTTGAQETTASQETTAKPDPTTAQEPTTSSSDVPYGNVNEVMISGVMTQSAGANGVAGIGFKASIDWGYLGIGENTSGYSIMSVRPKMDTSGPFVVDNAMYAVANPVDGNSYVDCGFVFNVKGNVKTAYYPITFEVEYIKDGVSYRVDKSVDIALYGNETETTTASDSATSVPRIIVTGFETNPEKVMAGQEFELTVHLQNTSNKTAVSNIKVTLSSANNEFLPSSGSSTEFIRSMGCGATKDIVIKMEAQGNLEQKPYVLAVDCEYEGEKNAPYTTKESISIPVYQEAKAKITDIEVMPMSIEVYSQANVMFSINNTGKSALYNVQVTVDSDNPYVQAEESFVGNINAGSTGYADFMVTGVAPTMDDGKVKVIISYEDAAGAVGTFETEIELFVYEAVYQEPSFDDGFVDPGMMEEEQGFPWVWLIAGIAAVVIVVVVTVIVIKKKKQKALEEELEDEIS